MLSWTIWLIAWSERWALLSAEALYSKRQRIGSSATYLAQKASFKHTILYQSAGTDMLFIEPSPPQRMMLMYSTPNKRSDYKSSSLHTRVRTRVRSSIKSSAFYWKHQNCRTLLTLWDRLYTKIPKTTITWRAARIYNAITLTDTNFTVH